MFDGVELNETQRTLLEAKELISDPEKWCKGSYGLDGQPQVCAVGAIFRVSRGNRNAPVLPNLNEVARKMGFVCANDLNDRTDHPTVMAMFDRAIELAGEEQ